MNACDGICNDIVTCVGLGLMTITFGSALFLLAILLYREYRGGDE